MAQCTPADTTYGCCLKRHLGQPWICGGYELEREASIAAAGSGGGAVASGGPGALGAVLLAAAVLDSDDVDAVKKLQDRLDETMRRCADRADEAMNRKWHGGRKPTPQECKVVMAVDRKGRQVTWAMVLGQEKHREALSCVEETLTQWMKDRYALEQRYRYLGQPGRVEPLSTRQVEQMLRDGRWRELVGTLEPDVVIHTGNLKQVLWVYEFKFPCVDPGATPNWNTYPPGHPYAGSNQGKVYGEAFNVSIVRIVPGKAVTR
jgi:hypothetical protein